MRGLLKANRLSSVCKWTQAKGPVCEVAPRKAQPVLWTGATSRCKGLWAGVPGWRAACSRAPGMQSAC